ncbi:MAG TPA: hypothetical protein VG273_03445 [Bryobacteraceae bacterium]|jgi:hypothetical protein|nr:hypothetical protein [Bryobacteraceae bacterium]
MKRLLTIAALCGPLLAQQPAPAPAPAAVATSAPAASPVPSDENWLTGYIDLGYRWETGVYGSFNTYRSIVDLGSGPKLLGAEFTLRNRSHRVFDQIDVRAYNWGDDPYESLHVGVRKAKLYDFSADYRNIAYYNNLPGYADPLFATTGVVLNEQSLDTRQKMSSFHLDLLPNRKIVPYLAYERNSSTGTGVANFVSGGDEFPVFNLVSNSTNDYRGGVRIELSRFHVTLEQGGTTFEDNQQLNQNTGKTNFGNFTTPLLGQTLSLTGLNEAYGVNGHSLYSKGLLTANLASWLDLYGQFLYSQPQSTVSFLESSTGNQVVLNQVLFYMGEQSIVASQSKMPHTSGSFGAEIRPFRRLRILPSWLTDRMHSSGSSVNQQSLTTAAGVVPLNTLLNSALSTNYNQAEVNLMYDLTSKITLRGGYRYVWGDATDVVLPAAGLAGLEQSRMRKNVALAGASWRPVQKLSFNTDFEHGSSGSAYFRTSLYNYDKARLRGRYQISQSFSLLANASVLNNRDPLPGLNYDFLAHQESASILFTPAGGKLWDFEGGYTRSTLRSNISYLDPEFLITDQSFYRDNSHTVTALFNFNMPGWLGYKTKLSLGGSAFLSSGSNPTTFYQPTAKLAIALAKNVAWVSEWRYYGFNESFYLFQGFRTQMVTTGVRISR